ncbi:MAG: metallophosphoesterase family protein [Candidatus Omnitrophota bacterium]
MKIGVLADIHIPQRADKLPDKLLEELKGVDMIILAGDLTVVSILKTLKEIAPVVAVRGNMDEPEVYRVLDIKEVVTAGKFRIGVFHGFGSPHRLIEVLKAEFKDDRVDVIVFGHSHQPMNEYRDGVLFFNPGSPTDKMFAPYSSYGIIEVNDELKAEIKRL